MENATMNMNTKYLMAVTLMSLTSNSLSAEDQPEQVFSISVFIGGISGVGLIGDSNEPLGGSWDYPEAQSGGFYVNSVAETPIEFEESGLGPQGSSVYGHARCTAAVSPTTVSVELLNHGIADSGEENLPFMVWTQATGEFHITIEAPATITYALCTDSQLSTNSTTFAIRKLENGNWNMDNLAHHFAGSNSGELCSEGVLQVEPGYYQLYFNSTCFIHSSNVGLGWKVSKVEAAALLEITPIEEPNPADINGDGKVDGIDLARILGAWGSTAGGGDLNGDGITDGQDLAILLGSWTG
jgi:hypothetical protein